MTDSTSTIALVRLIERKSSYSWQVIRCPFCLRQHTHGGGYHGGDPRRLLGSRRSHCADEAQRGTYELREVSL